MPVIRRKRTIRHEKAPNLGASGVPGPPGALEGPASGLFAALQTPVAGPYGASLTGPLGAPEPTAALRSKAALAAAAAAEGERGPQKGPGRAGGAPGVAQGALKEEAGKGRGPPSGAPLKNRVSELLETDMRSLSRGQRKRLAKREAAERRRDFAAYAGALLQQRTTAAAAAEGPSALDDLKAVGTALDEGPGGPPKGAPSKGQNTKRFTNKKRANCIEREIKQFDAIIGFGAFQQNPAAVLSQHLQNTIQIQQQQQQQQQLQQQQR